MATIIRMPEVLANSSEAAIQTWLVKLGDDVAIGAPLAEVETEKAIVEYAAETAGTVLRLLVDEGVSVKVGVPIAVVGAQGENVDGLVEDDSGSAPAPTAAAPTAAAPTAAAAAPSACAGSRTTAPETAPSPVASAPTESPPSSAAGSRRRSPVRQPPRAAPREGARARPVWRAGHRSGWAHRAPRPRGALGARVPRRRRRAATGVAPVEPSPVRGELIPHTRDATGDRAEAHREQVAVPHFYLVADCRVDKLIALRGHPSMKQHNR